MCHNWTNYSGVMVPDSCQWLLEILIKPNGVIYWLRNLSLIEAKSRETLNIEVVGNSTSLLKRVQTQNFDTGWRNHKGSKLMGFSRYDFELESIFFKFLLFFRVRFLMQYECMMSSNMSALYVPHQKKKILPNIDSVCIVGGKSRSSLWLDLMIWLTKIWLAYLQKSTIYIYDIHHHLSPKLRPCV
jgi:hypothetical protein